MGGKPFTNHGPHIQRQQRRQRQRQIHNKRQRQPKTEVLWVESLLPSLGLLIEVLFTEKDTDTHRQTEREPQKASTMHFKI